MRIGRRIDGFGFRIRGFWRARGLDAFDIFFKGVVNSLVKPGWKLVGLDIAGINSKLINFNGNCIITLD